MFSINRCNLKLSDINPRSELHGEEHVTAADLKFEMKASNDVLSEFDPTLKGALYRARDASDAQADLIDDPGHFPVLRFPLMSAFKWGKDFAGYTVLVHYGVSGRDDIVLQDCAIGGFRFDCQEGGTVVLSFRVQAHPDAVSLGRLCTMIQQDVDVTLEPPAAELQGAE